MDDSLTSDAIIPVMNTLLGEPFLILIKVFSHRTRTHAVTDSVNQLSGATAPRVVVSHERADFFDTLRDLPIALNTCFQGFCVLLLGVELPKTSVIQFYPAKELVLRHVAAVTDETTRLKALLSVRVVVSKDNHHPIA